MFDERGGSNYGGEGVNQLEHALQAAWLAEQEGASPALIAAALLHDIGHLLHELPEDAPDHGVDDLHEASAAKFLRGVFSEEVVESVGMHVSAKRYLCSVDPQYLGTLSPPSVLSLELQGGPMSPDECEAFRGNPHWADATRLRRWDDAAKTPGLQTPPLEHFLDYVRQVAL